MNRFLSFFVLLTAPSLFAQTTIIAHKSHSGTLSTFAYAPSGNFGEPPPRLVSVTKINDTTIIQHINDMGFIYDDTIYNHPIFSDPNMSVDTMQKMYYHAVEFKGFEKKIVEPVMEETLPAKQKAEPDQGKTRDKKASTPKKRKSNLFVLWIIGGGTFTGAMLLSRRRKGKLASA